MKKQKELKAIRITVEYDNGSMREAVGKDAAAIMEHWNSCEVMSYIHGQEYKGPVLKIKK
jgi:hypothetical protein